MCKVPSVQIPTAELARSSYGSEGIDALVPSVIYPKQTLLSGS